MDTSHLKWSIQPKVPRMYVMSNIHNAGCRPSTSANRIPTYALRFISNSTSSMNFFWSHCKAAFPFCDPPCCFCGTSLLLIYHLCMGFNHHSAGSFRKRWCHTSSQPALALSFIHRRLSINVCWAKVTSFFIIQESLLWSHLRYILIASKNNLGRSAHRGLMIPGGDVFPNT